MYSRIFRPSLAFLTLLLLSFGYTRGAYAIWGNSKKPTYVRFAVSTLGNNVSPTRYRMAHQGFVFPSSRNQANTHSSNPYVGKCQYNPQELENRKAIAAVVDKVRRVPLFEPGYSPQWGDSSEKQLLSHIVNSGIKTAIAHTRSGEMGNTIEGALDPNRPIKDDLLLENFRPTEINILFHRPGKKKSYRISDLLGFFYSFTFSNYQPFTDTPQFDEENGDTILGIEYKNASGVVWDIKKDQVDALATPVISGLWATYWWSWKQRANFFLYRRRKIRSGIDLQVEPVRRNSSQPEEIPMATTSTIYKPLQSE